MGFARTRGPGAKAMKLAWLIGALGASLGLGAEVPPEPCPTPVAACKPARA